MPEEDGGTTEATLPARPTLGNGIAWLVGGFAAAGANVYIDTWGTKSSALFWLQLAWFPVSLFLYGYGFARLARSLGYTWQYGVAACLVPIIAWLKIVGEL